jgi:cytochrome c-type biogenesis protein CcmH/NrfG
VKRPPRAVLVVGLLVVVLAFYLALLGVRGVSLLGDPRWVVKGLGLGVLLLPVVGVVIVAHEVAFGRAAQRLGERLAREQGAPAEAPQEDPVPFEVRRKQVLNDPDDWRAWYRLGAAYGEAGDVSRGRRAVRRAIALEKRSADDVGG